MASHSQWILDHLREYDSFLDSLTTIADMGCGASNDIHWWATLETRDDPPEPYNYKCYAVDIDQKALNSIPKHENINLINKDFTQENILPRSIDLMLAHDSFQYAWNPIETLRNWHKAMTVNGMLIISLQAQSGVMDNMYYSFTRDHSIHHYTPVNLIYMLALCGFDCRDAYLLKKRNDPWINIAVYKNDIEFMDPATTRWSHLVEKDLVHPSVAESVFKWGDSVKQEEVLYPWLDKENYFIDYQSVFEPLPFTEGLPVEQLGGQHKSVEKESEQSSAFQADPKNKKTTKTKNVGILRPPKRG